MPPAHGDPLPAAPAAESTKESPIVALHTSIVLFDDFDATTDGVTSHQFALDGVTWEIDLSEANLNRLREALRPFQTAGRRLPASRTTRAAARIGGDDRPATKAIRRWWLDNRDRADLPAFASSGRIPAAVKHAYRDAY